MRANQEPSLKWVAIALISALVERSPSNFGAIIRVNFIRDLTNEEDSRLL